MPKSHEIISRLGFQDEEDGMSFKKVHMKIKQEVEMLFVGVM